MGLLGTRVTHLNDAKENLVKGNALLRWDQLKKCVFLDGNLAILPWKGADDRV